MIQAIPTTYKKIRFRSKLEANWAKWLDENNIKWSYETQGFNLEDGTWYLPDFYLPEINIIIEVKGALEQIHKPFKMVQLLKRDESNWPDEGTMFLLAGPTGYFYNIDEWYSGGFNFNHCKKCGKTSIVTELGSYACRACGEHDGDHSLGDQIPVLMKPLKWLLLERD